MARRGGNKKRCEKYKQRGAKEINKKLRQEKHEKRLAKFAERKAERKETTQPKPKKESKGGDNLMEPHKTWNPNKTPYQNWTSIFRRLNNELEAEKKAEKAKGGITPKKENRHPDSV